MSAHGKLSDLQIGAYRLAPAVWADRELKPRLGLDLDQWQRKLVSAQRGSRQCVLTYRQSGKSTAAAVAASHSMIFRPGSTSLAIAPSQRQSAEVARRARAILIATGPKLTVDNLFELGCNGSRLVALPGSSDDTVRGLSVDAELIIDEAANKLLAAVITAMGTHAAQAVPMAITINGKTAGIPRITLSKRELVEQIGVELDAGKLKLGRIGDWEALRHELGRLQRVARQSGSVSYQAAEGEHDDLVTALSLALYGCRRLVPVRRPAVTRPAPRISPRAWT